MKIYVMRHGTAEDRTDLGQGGDADRALTAEGAERTRMALHGLISLGAAVDRIFTSPYLRATQTAGLASEVLGVPRLAIDQTPALLPDADGSDAADLVRQCKDLDGVLLVGHAPSIDEVVQVLLGLPHPVTSLKKAGLAVLSIKPQQTVAKLVALYEPKTLRQLGRIG